MTAWSNDTSRRPSGSPSSLSAARPPDLSSLTILMPVYNESATVLAAIDDALDADLPVDGAS